MSIVFQDTFDDGTFDAWTTAHVSANLTYGGQDGTYCLACCSANFPYIDGIVKELGSLYTAGAIRFQLAVYQVGMPAASYMFPFQWVQTGGPGNGLINFEVGQDGSFRLFSGQFAATPDTQDSAAGLFPVDGTWHGVQIVYSTSTAATHNLLTVNVYVDNVLKWTVTNWWYSLNSGGPGPIAAGWNGVAFQGQRSVLTPLTELMEAAVDTVQFDNAAASVAWPACSGATQLGQPVPTPTVTAVAMDFTTDLMTVTGTNFVPHFTTFSVLAPTFEVLPYTLVSMSSTQAILDLSTSVFIPGTYAVTPTTAALCYANPSTEHVGGAFDVTLTPPQQAIRRLRRFPLAYADHLWVFLDRIEFLLQTGVGLTTGQGSDPVLMLRLSRDGGHTWGNEIQLSMGKIGKYDWRAYTNKLGKGRDWVAEVVISDPVFVALLDCLIDTRVGPS